MFFPLRFIKFESMRDLLYRANGISPQNSSEARKGQEVKDPKS